MNKLIGSSLNRQEQVSKLMDIAGDIFTLLINTVTTLFKSAALILLYFFITATPETTVYQLSQLTHTVIFFKLTIMLAAIYAAIHFAANPTSKKHVFILGTTRYGKSNTWDAGTAHKNNKEQIKHEQN